MEYEPGMEAAYQHGNQRKYSSPYWQSPYPEPSRYSPETSYGARGGRLDYLGRASYPYYTSGSYRSVLGTPCIWGTVVLICICSIIIYSLVLSDCTHGPIGDLWLFKLSSGTTAIQVGYIGMCLGSRSGTTFNTDTASVLSQFGVGANSVAGHLLTTGRDLQAQFAIAFAFSLAALVLFFIWMVIVTMLPLDDPMRLAAFGMRPYDDGMYEEEPALVERMSDPARALGRTQRLSWSTWQFMAMLVAVPASIVALGSAWSLTTGTRAVEAVATDVAGNVRVQRGQVLEAVQWVAASMVIVVALYTMWLLVETRRKMVVPRQMDMYDSPPRQVLPEMVEDTEEYPVEYYTP